MRDLGEGLESDRETWMLGGGNPARIPQMENVFRNEMMCLLESGDDFERTIGSYDAPRGNSRFISALTGLLNDQLGWPVTDENIAVTNGSQSSFGILFNLFAGEFEDGTNRKILLPMTPEYIGYNDLGIGGLELFMARQPVITDDPEDDLFYKYRVDFHELDPGRECGAICVSRPTNPTGNVVTDSEVGKLADMARSADVPLIIDGAYGVPFPGIVFSDAKPTWDSNTILCLSLSKLGLPGVRTGIVVADPAVIEMITGSNAIFNLAPGRFGPSLVTRLVQSGELIELSEKVIRPFYERRVQVAVDLVREHMGDLPVRVHKPEGAIFLWLWCEGLPISSEQLYRNLKGRGVYVIAGQHFFPGIDPGWRHCHECIRVSYAGDEDTVRQGFQAIGEEIRAAYGQSPGRIANV